LSGVCLATALGTLGIGEYASDKHTDNLRACYQELSAQETEACRKDVGPDPDSVYGWIVLAFGAAGIYMGTRAYNSHETQVRRDDEYRQAEGIL
jgi:hypothetical protein